MRARLRTYAIIIILIIVVVVLLVVRFIISGRPETEFPGARIRLGPSGSPSHRTEITTQKEREARQLDIQPGIDFIEKNPLIVKLPHQEPTFILDHDATTDTYIVHMLFHGDKTIDEQIRESKQDALNWIRSQGVDPGTLKIEYTTN